MKKIVLVSLLAMSLPLIATAQSEDDLYYTPSKKTTATESTSTPNANRNVNISADKVSVTNNAPSTIIVCDSKGKVRNVDEYNRRYASKDYNYSTDNDTLYIDEKSEADKSMRGQWTNKFDGTDDDYEYATRIIRFQSPRYAIPISSPLYWDVVYGFGMNSWDWNVYYDDFYAYAFPTFTNRLWWDWRFGPSWGWGWNNWYGGSYGYYGGYYDSWYGWGSPYYYGWYGRPYYDNYAWGGPGWGGRGWRGSSYDRFAGNRGYNNFANERYSGRGGFRGNDMMSSGRMDGSNSRFAQGNNSRSEVTRMGGVGSRSMGRVVGSRDMGNSVRPNNFSGSRSMGDGNVGRNMDSSRGSYGGDNAGYSRGRTTYGSESSNMYSRPSSTRSSVYSSEGRSMSRGEGSFRSSSESRSFDMGRSSSNSSFNSGSRSSGGFSSGGGFSGGGSRGGGGGSVGGGGGSRGGGGGGRR